MDGKELRKRAVSRAHELPGTELTHPFGLDSEVWKICEKVFMFLAELGGEEIGNSSQDSCEYHPGVAHEQEALDHHPGR